MTSQQLTKMLAQRERSVVEFKKAREKLPDSLLEASSDLAQWTTLAAAFSADGTVEYSDADVANISPRFYRVRWLP